MLFFFLHPSQLPRLKHPRAAISTAQQFSLSQHYFFLPKTASGNSDFPGERDVKEGESRPTASREQERVSPDMPCLIASLQAHLLKQ